MKIFIFFIISFLITCNAHAGIFSSKQGITFETKGEAIIMKNSTFTTGIERRNIPIPIIIDVRIDSRFSSLTHDSESGWTLCRVPLRGELGLTGITEKSLVFDCKPLQYFKN